MNATKNVGMWHRGGRGERKHSITPGDARTFANPTCGASVRLLILIMDRLLSLIVFSERDPGSVWFCSVYLVTTAGFVADQLV